MHFVPIVPGVSLRYLNLSHILTDYHRIYPGISYSLTVDGSNMLLQMLDSRSINAAFVISSEAALQHKEDLFFHRIMDDRYVAIVSRQNPLSGQPSISMQDLQSENIIMPAKESAFRKELEQVFDQHYIAPRILCETSQSDIVMQLASQNLAIGFASNSIAQALKTAGLFHWKMYSFVPFTTSRLRNCWIIRPYDPSLTLSSNIPSPRPPRRQIYFILHMSIRCPHICASCHAAPFVSRRCQI